MSWTSLRPSACGTHHLEASGQPAYPERFDQVLKFHAPGLAPVRTGQSAWHIQPDGSAVYRRRFRQSFGFYEGLAAVVGDTGWHHIDPLGQDAYPQRYAWCGNFQGGRCSVREPSGGYLHITAEGVPAYTARWHYVGDYRDEIAVVQGPDGRSTHIDLDGHCVHGRWFLDLDVYHKGFARARDVDGWTHIDAAGNVIYARRFASVEPFYNGQARVECFDGGLEVIDEHGKTLVELRPALRSEFAALSADLVGYWKTQVIAAAVELGLIESLPGTIGELARRCHLFPERAERLLRALGELALVRNEQGMWQLTGRGAYLRSSHPLTLADAALEYAGALSQLWEALPRAMQETGGWRAPRIFTEVAQTESRCISHHRMLQSYARHDYACVPAALGLNGQEHIVDAGGGLGTLARLLLEYHPELKVTVLDLPEVVAQARKSLPDLPGLHWQPGDFFKSWNLKADAVLLARVLHDWDDEQSRLILQRARQVLPKGGQLFIVEMVLDENSLSGALCDLHLLMATGGQERTAAAYSRLLAAAGFELREVRPLAALPKVLVGVAR